MHASNLRRDSPVCFGKRTSHGNDRRRFGVDYQSQARFTGLLRQANEPRRGSPSTSVENEPRFNCRFGDDRITDSTDASASTESSRQPARASAQTNRLRRDSPVCFGKRTSHGNDRRRFGADYQSQARFTGLLRQANEPRRGSPSTSVENEPRFNCRFGDDRITDSTDASASTESSRQPARASAQTNRLRRDSPVCFGSQTSHRKRRRALRCTTRGSRRSSPSTSVVKELRFYIPARAVTRRT